ncbi:hypothetical protein IAT38_005931 [Cryptococcus sp. DSM 104549]
MSSPNSSPDTSPDTSYDGGMMASLRRGRSASSSTAYTTATSLFASSTDTLATQGSHNPRNIQKIRTSFSQYVPAMTSASPLHSASVQESPADGRPRSLSSTAGSRVSSSGSFELSTPTHSPSTLPSLDTLSAALPFAEPEFVPPILTGRYFMKTMDSITLVGVDGSEHEMCGLPLAYNRPFFEDVIRPYVALLPPPESRPDSFDVSPLRIYLQHPGDTRDVIALAMAADECVEWSELGALRDLPLKAFSGARQFAKRYLGFVAREVAADHEKAKKIGLPADEDYPDEWLSDQELLKDDVDDDESDYEESGEEGASDER